MKTLGKILLLLVGLLLGLQLWQWKQPSFQPTPTTVTLMQVDTVTVQQVLHDTVIRFVDRIRFRKVRPETVFVAPIRGDTGAAPRFLGLDYTAPRLEVYLTQDQMAKRLIYSVPPAFSLRYAEGRLFREVQAMVDRAGRLVWDDGAGARTADLLDADLNLGIGDQPEGAVFRGAGGIQPHGGPRLEVLNAA